MYTMKSECVTWNDPLFSVTHFAHVSGKGVHIDPYMGYLYGVKDLY